MNDATVYLPPVEVTPADVEPLRVLNAKLEAQREAKWRKERPLARGVLDYFPDALLEVAYCSFIGNQQHHADKPLHWDKSKSTDEADCALRHLAGRGTIDTDGVRHSAKAAWRALANLQRELDAARAAGTYPEFR